MNPTHAFPIRRTAVAAACILLVLQSGCGGDDDTPPATQGAFYGVEGLSYNAGRGPVTTPAGGTIGYDAATQVTFSVGGLVLGTASGGTRMTVADLVPAVAGDVKQITHQKVTNLARFLQSLDDDANIDNGVRITAAVSNAVGAYAGKIDFDQTEDAFSADPNVVALFGQLGKRLVTGPQARNPLRRTMLGIHKSTEIDVPMRDGTLLKADVWQPIEPGKYPVLVNVGAYGKEFSGAENRGCICNSADDIKKARDEDNYFEGKPVEGTPDFFPNNHENHETLNTVDFVPRGYVKVSVDDRGRCNSPGKFEQFSLQEAQDFHDAVEWAAVQPYSNGNAGTWTLSYWSIVTLTMAGLQPPHLKAIMPMATDTDTFRQVLFNGGLWNNFNFIAGYSCRSDTTQVAWPTIAQANPFYTDAMYGTAGSLTVAADMDKITIPMFTMLPLEHPAIHTKGSSEAYIRAATPTANKKLAIVEGELFAWAYEKENVSAAIDFLDYWLKDKKDNGAMSGAPVRIKVRTGDQKFVWQEEQEWPIARTEYRKLYIDAAASGYGGDGLRTDFRKISNAAPTADASASWAADIPATGTDCWRPGVSFITEPLTEDLTLAGYMKLVTSVASSSSDMDIVASVRVIDPSNKAVTLALPGFFYNPQYPLGYGWLQVSRRKTDPAQSTVYRPTYTMSQADYAPLTAGQPVPVEVELWPTTGKVVKGSRLRLDVQPTDGCGAPSSFDAEPGPRHIFNAAYKTGQTNTLFTGPSHPSYLQIPVIPAKH